ncbi:MAG: serine/threonine protein kinase [Bacteroidales bacterium]|nr:serine/threonine protein kinase [Bacteroidales bacterium]
MSGVRELSAGKTLYNGKYIIERVLGMGGFGITYYARHATLQRYYAIKEFFISGHCMRNTQTSKILLQGIKEDDFNNFKKKFIEESRTLAKMEHPNIVKVVDVFNENNTFYMVMPFIEGPTLQKLVETEGKLDYDIAVNYVAQIAEAMSYIHAKGILHRDIKPDNIIITPDYTAVLIDFGSAREFVHDKTQSHTSVLTKGYAPLEQYSVISKKGSYSDIYSLGAVFYFVLTGEKPMDAVERNMNNMPSPKELEPNIPEEANTTIMKAMQLKPEERYQTASEFMDVLLGNDQKQTKKRRKTLWIWLLLGAMIVASGIFLMIKYMDILPMITKEPAPVVVETEKPDVTPENNMQKEPAPVDSLPAPIIEENKIVQPEKTETAPAIPVIKVENTTPEKKENNTKKENTKPAGQEDITSDPEYWRRQGIQDQKQIEQEIVIEPENQEPVHSALELLSMANEAFASAQYQKAFDLYKQLQSISPSDKTGYNRFLNHAKGLVPHKGYDKYVKALLTFAQKLDDTEEVRTLLDKCN